MTTETDENVVLNDDGKEIYEGEVWEDEGRKLLVLGFLDKQYAYPVALVTELTETRKDSVSKQVLVMNVDNGTSHTLYYSLVDDSVEKQEPLLLTRLVGIISASDYASVMVDAFHLIIDITTNVSILNRDVSTYIKISDIDSDGFRENVSSRYKHTIHSIQHSPGQLRLGPSGAYLVLMILGNRAEVIDLFTENEEVGYVSIETFTAYDRTPYRVTGKSRIRHIIVGRDQSDLVGYISNTDLLYFIDRKIDKLNR